MIHLKTDFSVGYSVIATTRGCGVLPLLHSANITNDHYVNGIICERGKCYWIILP